MATILILDDDVRFRAMAQSLLEPRGHTVLHASRCSDARKMLGSRAVDLLIVDALLPDGTGPDFIRERRAAKGQERVLLVSAFWKKELATVAREAGAQAAMVKPVVPQELVRKVEQLTRASTGSPAAAEPLLTAEAINELSAMRLRFADELPGLVNGVRLAVDQLRARPQAPGLYGVARRRAHQLAGIAGSFGFDAVGECCATIEEALVALQAGTTNAWARIDEAVAQLLPEPVRSSPSVA